VFIAAIFTEFGQLILRKIIKIFTTRRQILRLKCTKFDIGWGSAPNPTGGAYISPPNALAGFKGPTSKGRVGEGKEGEGIGRVGMGRGLIGLDPVPLLSFADLRPW